MADNVFGRFIPNAQQQSGSGVTVVPQNPYAANQEGRADTQTNISVAKEARSAASENAGLPYIAPKAAADVARAQAEAEKSALELEKARREQQTQPSPLSAKTQRKLQTDSVLGALNTARSQIGEGYATGNFFGTKGWQSIPALGQSSTNLAATLSGLQGSMINDTLAALKAMSPSGASGYGSLTETEAQRLSAAIGALQQSQDEKSLLDNLAKVERHYRNSLALLEGKNPYDEAVQVEYGIVPEGKETAPPTGKAEADGGSPPKRLTSEGRFVADPGLRGTNATVQRMIERGSSPADIRAYLDRIRPGMGASVGGIDEAVANWRLAPNKRAEVGFDLEKVWEPASGISQTLGNIGMSPVGAALIGAGDVASLGTLDNLTANPEMTRSVMAGVREGSPNAYLAGQVGGGVAGALGLGAGLGRAGVSAARAGLGADVALGAGYGAGSADNPDQSRIANALLGGGAALAGNKIGGAIANTGGRLLAGVTDPSRRALQEAGVPMTPGQILGGAAQRTEDRIAGFPIVGDAIQARRREGIEAFDRAAFDEALSPIGATTGGRIAEPGAQAAQAAVSQAYRDALSGVNVATDAPYVQGANQLAAQIQGIPRLGPELYEGMKTAISPMIGPGGQITGDAMQDILQGVQAVSSQYRGSPMQAADPLYASHVAPAVDAYTTMLEDLVERQAPGTIQALRAANQANRNVGVVGDAVTAAANQGGEFMPSQLMNASRANAKRFSGKRATASGQGPLFDIARAGQDVLPSKVPDSGTAGRLLVPLAAGGLVGGGSYAAQGAEAEGAASNSLLNALIAGGLLAAPYSRGATGALQSTLMAERPELARKAGDYLLKNDRIAEILAAPTATLMIADK